MKKFTKFQIKVFKAVSKIPLGQTRSYKWMAKEIGRPRAYRAVGQALKSNPYPLIIPCHRVIRADGTLGGYSGKKNSQRKRELLEIEKRLAKSF